MVLIRDSSEFVGKQIKVNTIKSSETGKLIIIEENGILVKRDDGIHAFYFLTNIVSIEYIPTMGITTTIQQKKLQEKEEDDMFKDIDKERVKLLIRVDKIKELLDDDDFQVEINVDKIEIDNSDTAEIVDDEIIVYDEEFIQLAKEIADEFDLKIDRQYEE